MERRHLEYFLAVAEAGSFTRAAALLTIAQPSLSHSIAALERELGSELFERLGRGVRLTPAGEALVEPARRALRSFTLAKGAVRSVADAGFGRLSIISGTLWAIEPLVRMIGEFRLLHPAVQFTVSDPLSRSEVLDAVRSGEADFGLLDGTAPAGALASRWLVDHELVAVLPNRPSLSALSLGVADLAPLGLVSTPKGTPLRTLLDEQLELAGQPAEVAVETAHLASVVPLVLAGAGAALLPEGLASDAAAKGARVVRLTPATRASVHIIWREGRLNSLGEHFLTVGSDLYGILGPTNR
jgi:LysR family transcriptional regulator, carnitine catabolism transcriptional activator